MRREESAGVPRFLGLGGPSGRRPLEPFPDAARVGPAGLAAIGGDLSVERLLLAYDGAIFPCYGERTPPLWWSPDPRAVVDPSALHVSRRLARTLRQRRFALTWNRAFRDVIRACAADRDDATWILPELIEAYEELHRLGHAHSLEVWQDGRLAGGLYGVQRGAFFAAESMFHRARDMSKVALVAAVRSLFAAGVVLFDVQYLTTHLASLGAREMPRAAFLALHAAARRKPVRLAALQLRV